MDATGLGVKGTYGIMDGLDVVGGYAVTTLVNIPALDDILPGVKQTSGSILDLGVKYTLPKSVNMLPCDAAVLVGYEQSTVGLKADNLSNTSVVVTTYALAAIFSKQIGICVPYGGVALKSLSQDLGKTIGGSKVDAVPGTGLMFNLGVYVGIADNQAVAIEYDTENDSWGEVTAHGHSATGDKDGSASSVSGLSVGYVYMF